MTKKQELESLQRLKEMRDMAATKTTENVLIDCKSLAELWAKDYQALKLAIQAIEERA